MKGAIALLFPPRPLTLPQFCSVEIKIVFIKLPNIDILKKI